MTEITLYHGSQTEFDKFLINPEFSRHNTLMEGHGIYMTEDTQLAKGYGDFLYEVNVPTDMISDFTNEESINSLLTTLAVNVDVNFEDWIDLEGLIQSAMAGEVSITELYIELNGLLESNEAFYLAHDSTITYEEDCLFEKIKEEYLQLLKPVIKYYDKSFDANIFICIKEEGSLNPSLVK